MSKLPIMNGLEVVKKLEKLGFAKHHQRGSHLVMNGPSGVKVVVPYHTGKDIPKGTLHNIVVHQAKLTIEEFLKA